MSMALALVLFAFAAALVGALHSSRTGPTQQRQQQHRVGRSTRTPYRYYSQRIRRPFNFDLVKQADGEVRIYIVAQPGYRSRATDGHSTHRYRDEAGRYYVCVRHDLRPTNLSDARSWARYWADGTAKYIKSGRPFS